MAELRNQIHGLTRVRKIAMGDGAFLNVQVVDGEGCVHLCLSTSAFPAGLTPDEARQVAADLVKSADRVGEN